MMCEALAMLRRCLRLSAVAVLVCSVQDPLAQAQQQPENSGLPLEQRAQVTYDAYILGPGDGLQIELLDLPELSGNFSIGPDGTLYLPRLRALYVEGLTVEELRYFLTQQFSAYVRDPQVYVRPVAYRPIRVFVGGEVKRPGYYTLSGVQTNEIITNTATTLSPNKDSKTDPQDTTFTTTSIEDKERFTTSRGLAASTLFPTVFDAIRSAEGITPYSKLSDVQVTRNRALALGGGRIRANLDFLSLITEGDQSQNIRLFDGDTVIVSRSETVLRDQLLKAGQTNLSPQFLEVFVNGRVKAPGGVTVPQGSSLNQAIALAGGPKLLRGKVEFVRFTKDGEIERRIFSYNANAPSDAPNNPVLMAGDLITIQESPISATVTVLNELTGPAVGVYSVYSLFK